jgi:hypothetical protein
MQNPKCAVAESSSMPGYFTSSRLIRFAKLGQNHLANMHQSQYGFKFRFLYSAKSTVFITQHKHAHAMMQI